MKSRKILYGKTKEVKLNIIHYVMITKFGGSGNVDIKLKIVSLKCLWIRRSYNEYHHDCKIIPLNYINTALGKNFKFHYNLSILNETIKSLPTYYKDLIDSWFKYYYCPSKVPS